MIEILIAQVNNLLSVCQRVQGVPTLCTGSIRGVGNTDSVSVIWVTRPECVAEEERDDLEEDKGNVNKPRRDMGVAY